MVRVRSVTAYLTGQGRWSLDLSVPEPSLRGVLCVPVSSVHIHALRAGRVRDKSLAVLLC